MEDPATGSLAESGLKAKWLDTGSSLKGTGAEEGEATCTRRKDASSPSLDARGQYPSQGRMASILGSGSGQGMAQGCLQKRPQRRCGILMNLPLPEETQEATKAERRRTLTSHRKPISLCPQRTVLCFPNPSPQTMYSIAQELECFLRGRGKVKTGPGL